jgi:hypothetical protein
MRLRVIAAVVSCVAADTAAYAQEITVLQTDKIEVIGKTTVHIQNESELAWRLVAIFVPILVAGMAAVFTNWLATRRDRASKAADVQKTKIALLHELSSRVAHCAFDYEKPWRAWGGGIFKKDEKVKLKRVLKFKPVAPVMYPPDTATFGCMSSETASALINFYTALGRWEREVSDAEYSAKDEDGDKIMPWGDLIRLSRRLGETLAPGKAALAALVAEVGVDVPADEIIKANFVAYYRFAVPNDDRSARVSNMHPFLLLDELAATARKQKEEEQKGGFSQGLATAAYGLKPGPLVL